MIRRATLDRYWTAPRKRDTVTRPGNAGELAEMLNVNFADVGCRHDFDDFREAGPIEPCRSAPSKARKAL